MQRIVSRSQFPAFVADSDCQGNRPSASLCTKKGSDPLRRKGPDPCFVQSSSAWGTLLAAATFLLASHGLVFAADPDNILLDFTAVWCEPCQRMSSIVSKLERQQLPIRKVDVNQEPGLAKKYGVESIPCFVLVANGKELERVNGITTEQQLRSMLGRLPKTAPVATAGSDGRQDAYPTLGRLPKTAPIAAAPARTLPETRRNETLEPILGTPIPLPPTTSGSNPPGHSLPPAFAGTGKGNPPFAEFEESDVIRLQNFEGDPSRSSVRIRVKDGNAIILGSGTIIDSQPGIGGQPGQAMILTCAHIFRKLSKTAVVEIDLFISAKPAKSETVLGRVVLTDADADLGLVKINHAHPLPTVRLGLSGAPLVKDEALFSIGCGGGDNPSRENLKLTAINKYDGPENLECTNRPQEGRSGGGLFRDDELVGICVAADPDFPLGIYTGLRPVGLLLEKAGLTHLAPRTPRMPTFPAAIAATDEQKNNAPPAAHVQTPLLVATADDDLAGLLSQMNDRGAAGGATAVPQDLAGAEIICIVRSKTPGKPSRVVIVNQATERFVADLLNESGGGLASEQNAISRSTSNAAQRGHVETSLELKPYRRIHAK